MRRPRAELGADDGLRPVVAASGRAGFGPVARPGLALAVLLGLGGAALAQSPARLSVEPQQRWRLQPSASVTQTFTDNLQLRSDAHSADSVTRLTAGLGLRARSGAVQGYLDYALSGLVHARNSDRNTHQNALNSAFTAELVEGRAAVDVAAGISQAALSALGVQPLDGGLPNVNSTELRTLRVSPRVQGPLGPDWRYTANLSYAVSDTSGRSNSLGNSDTATLGVHIEQTQRAKLSWSVDASHLVSDFKAGRRTEDDRVIARLSRRLDDHDLELSANAGGEYTNQASIKRQFHTNWGVGATWAPSPRTRLSGEVDQRFFGKSYSLALEHRTPLTVWRISDARTLSDTAGGVAGGARGTAYDLFFAQFASLQPDPAQRSVLVEDFLRSNGIDPAALINPGFLRASTSLQQRLEMSVAWRGVRSAAVVTAGRTATRRADSIVSVADDLATSSEIVQHHVMLDLSHRLTPMDTVALILTRLSGASADLAQRSHQRLVNLRYTTRLTPDSTLDLGLRRALYANLQGPFDESAVFATLGLRF